MLGGLLILVLTGLFAHMMVNKFAPLGSSSNRLMKTLFYYHVALSLAYYLYVMFNPSDSKNYYHSASSEAGWFSFYGTSTTFIKFLHYPFGNYLGFSYEASMMLFSFIGYLGFLFFYIAFKERIKFTHKFFGVNLLTLIFFLPNLHFWTGSLGKGSVIFLGIGLFFYAMNNPRNRIWELGIGSIIIYHVRPHIMLVMLVSYALALVFSTKGISVTLRLTFLASAAIAFGFIYKDVLGMVGIDEEAFISQGLDLTHRATELSKATSGVNITSYSLPLQVFTFLYRPLFVDAPGALGIFVSFENVFYLVITLKLLTSLKGWRFLFTADFLTKGALFSFLTVSIALAQISGNLGLAMRQKSQIMILLLFVIISFMDHEKMKQWQWQQVLKKRKQSGGAVSGRQSPVNS